MLALLLISQLTVAIPAGEYRPLYGRPDDAPVAVTAFQLDRSPVTRDEFLAFVRAHPEWRRSRTDGRLVAANTYLATWPSDTSVGTRLDGGRPVTEVSWHAARAYCAARGARLPTTHEWEYVAAASATARNASRDPVFRQAVLARQVTRRAPIAPVARNDRNAYGVLGMLAAAEWVADFPAAPDVHRHHDGVTHDRSCAGAALGATDPSNYAAFLRDALRASLVAQASLPTLGFRCAR